ncbi:MAG: radical SAM protein [Oscillospiraceae bacterium]|nr:radical SAM protein [Oscillospiraceae bacterium]
MDVILPATDTMQQLCACQRGVPDDTWRMTHHALRIPCQTGELLYHTMTGCLLQLSPTEVAVLDTDTSLRSQLAERWFIVPPEFDERKHAREVRHVLRLMQGTKKHVTSFTVLPTTACNARCAYCFEQGAPILTMDEPMAHRVADYIATASSGEKVSISWFGGEPLCNIPAIRTICRDLRQRSVPFDGIMTSNGYYLTPSVAREAREDWHLNRIQITLDGTKDVYKRIKRYVGNPEDPFSRVVSNIEAALNSGIHVTIRLNMDRENADNLYQLVDQLKELFAGQKDCSIVIMPLRAFTCRNNDFFDLDQKEAAYRKLAGKVAKYGMIETSPFNRALQINRCKADNDGCEVILPDGHIGKCEHRLEGPYVGHIDSPKRDAALISAWKQEQPEFPTCEDCPIFPVCIRTSDCDWMKHGCDELDRKFRIEKHCNGALSIYRQWQETHR